MSEVILRKTLSDGTDREVRQNTATYTVVIRDSKTKDVIAQRDFGTMDAAQAVWSQAIHKFTGQSTAVAEEAPASFPCPTCDRVFQTEAGMRQHVLRGHSTEEE